MPVAIEMLIPVTDIKKGDRVYDKLTGLDSTHDTVAYEVKRGNKFMTIVNANQQVISRREFGVNVTVERMMPTEEEIAAKQAQHEAEKREFFAKEVEKWVTSALDSWAEFVAAQAQHIIDFPGQNYHNPFDSMMEQGARVRIAQQILNIRNNGGDLMDWADAFDNWTGRAHNTLIAGIGFSNSALSRSTSIISNLTEDVFAAEMRKLLDSAKFGYIR